MTGLHAARIQPQSASGVTDSRKRTRRQRKVHHKVKTGCTACKARRQKCDERKPVCSGCSRYSTDCLYQASPCPRPHEAGRSDGTNTTRRGSTVPVPRPSLQISPSSDLHLGDLELLHQFLMSTCMATAQLPASTAYLQTTIPPLAQAYPFAMRGVLAMAATHLSRLRPSRQAHYALVAAKNHSAALPEFRSALQKLSEDNCDALIFYAKSILWCSLASHHSSNEPQDGLEMGDNWLPQWFFLLRGSCQVVESSRKWIQTGPHVVLEVESGDQDSTSVEDDQTGMLMSQLLPLTGLDASLGKHVISALREAFVRASMRHHNTPYRNALNFWVSSLSDEYVDLLQKKEPWALVVLAHFAVLLHRSETVWFMKGHATRLLLSIAEHLDTVWKPFLNWPCRELGIE